MPDQPADYKLGPDGSCPKCGERHARMHRGVEKITCAGHTWYDRDDERDEGGRRTSTKRDTPRPCRALPAPGLDRCGSHGVNRKQREAAKQRIAEEKLMTAARKLIPDADDRTPITNPLEKLLELAGEADAFRESLRCLANDVEEMRYRGGSGEQLRAEIATYRQAFKDTTDVLIAIARLDIEKMLARIESRKVEMTIEALQLGCDQAGLSDEQKRAVIAGVGRHLRAVRAAA